MKKLSSAVFLFLLACAAHAGVKIQHWTAPSGAQVFFAESRELPILDVQVDFVAGSAYDPPGKAGLSAMTRGLLDAGAGGLDEEQIAARLADLGARLSGTGDYDRAGLALRTLASKTERDAALELMRIVLAQPGFPEAMVARDRQHTVSALQEADTRPETLAMKRFAAAIYPDHPYGATATPESVARIERADVVDFHRRYYGARRAVVSIIGDISRAEAEAIAQRLTEGLPAGETATELPAVKAPERAVLHVAHPATQSHILLGLPAERRSDPDYFALLVANYTFGGGGFVSRLMKEVRESRGYAYDVQSYFAPRRLEGPFVITLQTKRSQAGDALKVVQSTLDEYLKTGPSAAELKAAKQNLVDGQALRIDSNAKILGYLALIGFYGLPLTYLDDFPAKVNAVTAQQARDAFARHVRPEHLVTVVVAGE